MLSRAVRLPPLHRDGFSSSYKYRAGCSCALHGAGVGRVLELFLGPGGGSGAAGIRGSPEFGANGPWGGYGLWVSHSCP